MTKIGDFSTQFNNIQKIKMRLGSLLLCNRLIINWYIAIVHCLVSVVYIFPFLVHCDLWISTQYFKKKILFCKIYHMENISSNKNRSKIGPAFRKFANQRSLRAAEVNTAGTVITFINWFWSDHNPKKCFSKHVIMDIILLHKFH